jgi:hypothetical protein
MVLSKFAKSILVLTFSAAFAAGCAHRSNHTEKRRVAQTETKVQPNTKAPISELSEEPGSHVVSTLKFPLGQTKLTPAARAELAKAIRLAEDAGEVEEITVVVWSDQEFPAPGEKLPRAQVNLADKRGDEIEDFLEDKLNAGSVAVHNMAKHPTYLGRYFNTTDARIKQDLVKSGLAPVGDDVTTNRRSSTALIMVKAK